MATSNITLWCDKTISTKTHDFTTYYHPNLEYDEPMSLSLTNGSLFYSWYNCSASNGNNIIKISSDSGSTWKTLTIPDGQYSLEDFAAYMKSQLSLNSLDTDGIVITPNYNIQRVYITLKTGYQLDLTASTFYNLIGFTSAIITTSAFGTSIPDITNGINQILVNIDCVNSSTINNTRTSTIYSFVPSSKNGGIIILNPTYPMYLPMVSQRVQSIRLWLSTPQGKPVDLNGEATSFTFYVKPQRLVM